MLCSICQQKEATVHLTQIMGEKVQKLDLCDACAEQKGVGDPTGFDLVNLLKGAGVVKELEAGPAGAQTTCPQCGYTQAELKKSGRLGCPTCYTTFADSLEGMLRSMHKGLKHVGKAPAALQTPKEGGDKVKALQRRLAKAIEEEDFELAAQLRDEIKQLGGKGAAATTSTST